VADLHLHSKYSRAVSQQMIPQIMAQWARKKGIDLIATGDWTHPLWLKELESQLEEGEEGIYKLGNNQRLAPRVQFVLSTEISSIYSQGGKLRRIHNLVIAPSFKIVHQINEELKRRGCNLMSDGRPIIGLSSMQLAELVWSIDESCLIIPAHCWTPWFSMYGSKSGFDSLKECWGNYSDRIYAIETGLSSDPAMNWRIKDLDTRAIVSFGDSHSPAKLGRELTVFRKKVDKSRESRESRERFSFKDLAGAIKQTKDGDWEIAYTIEFYPEEGKYHYSGHRNCGVKQSPQETKKKGAVCPVCGRPLTLGVMHRVEELSGREEIKPRKKTNEKGVVGYYNPLDETRPPYIMLVPLMEILSESFNLGVSSIRVKNEYENLTKNLAPELEILTQTKLEEIEKLAGSKAATAIKKVREGNIVVEPGFDGVFGTVKIWPPSAKTSAGQEKEGIKSEQVSLF
jgi:uncharacterized protein (TIGR00375 family)